MTTKARIEEIREEMGWGRTCMCFACKLKRELLHAIDEREEQAGMQENIIDDLARMLDCRAGKLLKKGKFFLCVAHDESYFSAVYEVIRAREMTHGEWTDEDEKVYQHWTRTEPGYNLSTNNIEELETRVREYKELDEARKELKKLTHGNRAERSMRDTRALVREYEMDVKQ